MDDLLIPPPERIKSDVEHLKDWLSKEPHLAHLSSTEDEDWLESFLYNNKFSLEKTKYKLENLCSLRSKYPEICKNRNPTGEDLAQLKRHFKQVLGHKPTRDGMMVIQSRYEGDSDGFDGTAYLNMNIMLTDMAILDKRNRLVKIISIMDLKDFKPGYILKLWPLWSMIAEISDKVYSVRFKAIHVINLPSYAQKFLETALKLMPGKLQKRTHIHGATKNTLFEALDEELICSDFGGKGPSIAELEEQIQKKLEQAREWFENQGTLCANEELRTKDSKQIEDMRGSFRKLEVD